MLTPVYHSQPYDAIWEESFVEPLHSPAWDQTRTCCFTGHRPDRLPSGWRQDPDTCTPLRMALRDAVLQAVRDGYDIFLSGMALGVDLMAAKEVLELKKVGYPLRLIAAIPCPEQDACWREPDRRAYRTLLEQADEQVLICPHYTPYCMHARNRWMVEHSARVIAVFDGSPGGTANTIQLAQKKRREIVRIDPLNPFAFSL